MDSDSLLSQVTLVIGQLHELFNIIGLPNHERVAHESALYAALTRTLNEQLKLMNGEKDSLTATAEHLISNMREMEVALTGDHHQYDQSAPEARFVISPPLLRCVATLKAKHTEIARTHLERCEQINKLIEAINSYSSHLEPSFVAMKMPARMPDGKIAPGADISASCIASLDQELSRAYSEYTKRVEAAKAYGEEIVNLWAELGTPQSQTKSSIVSHYRDAPEQLGLHQKDLLDLKSMRDQLAIEKHERENYLRDMSISIEALWDRLSVETVHRKGFQTSHRGCGLRVVNGYEAELNRLNELKRQNIGIFVDEARNRIQDLWDGLYFSEEDMLQFTPAFSDVYSDALLATHEAEISRLESLTEQRKPNLSLIKKHMSLIQDREDLAASSQDASRLLMKPTKGEKRDPTRLLREEKMRKRIAKELPRLETELRRSLQAWENEYGRPFLIHGEPYSTVLGDSPPRSTLTRPKTPSTSLIHTSNSTKVPLKAAGNHITKGTTNTNTRSRSRSTVRSGACTPSTNMSKSISTRPMAGAQSTRTPSRIPARPPLSLLASGNRSVGQQKFDGKNIDQGNRNTSADGRFALAAPPPKIRNLDPQHLKHQTSYCRKAKDSTADPHFEPTDEQLAPAGDFNAYLRSSGIADRLANPSHITRTIVGPSRYISGTSGSSTMTGIASGSENWETLDDGSESDACGLGLEQTKFAVLNKGKRLMPEDGYAQSSPSVGKKYKDNHVLQTHRVMLNSSISNAGEKRYITAGSESAWTDEEAF